MSKKAAGSTCTFECDDGFAVEGPAETLCLDNGMWSDGDTARCVQQECSIDLMDIEVEHGQVACNDLNAYGSTCSILCHQGFIPVSETRSVTCMSSKISDSSELVYLDTDDMERVQEVKEYAGDEVLGVIKCKEVRCPVIELDRRTGITDLRKF